MLKVLLLSDFTSAYSRLLLKGFLRYSMEVGNWRFYRIPLSREDFNDEKAIETVIDIAQRWGADAIMGQLSEVNTERLRSIGIPVILQNYTNRVDGISNITGDYYGTGEMAANYFLRKGYTNFAFYGTSDTIWSREREEGFCTRLAEVGQHAYIYNEESNIHFRPADPPSLVTATPPSHSLVCLRRRIRLTHNRSLRYQQHSSPPGSGCFGSG